MLFLNTRILGNRSLLGRCLLVKVQVLPSVSFVDIPEVCLFEVLSIQIKEFVLLSVEIVTHQTTDYAETNGHYA